MNRASAGREDPPHANTRTIGQRRRVDAGVVDEHFRSNLDDVGPTGTGLDDGEFGLGIAVSWMATFASGRSMEKFATFDTTRIGISPRRNAPKRSSRTLLEVCPLTSGAPRRAATVFSWSMYWPMHDETA